MTPEEIESALARLRDAGRLLRERPARSRLDALASLLDAWSRPGSPWQARLAPRLAEAAGFSPACANEGLARGLAPYTGEALRSLVASELGGIDRLDGAGPLHAAGFETTAQVLAGPIPMPAIVAITAPLALGSPVLVKPSLHDRVTARLFARSLAEADPGLGACVEIADFRAGDTACTAALAAADCVAVTGSDEAVAAVARLVASPRRLVASGHRISVALLGPGATRGAALAAGAAGLALDVALWDQLGCLSPVALWVADSDGAAADRVAEALAAELARAEESWPRGRIAPEAAAAIARERAEAEMRAAAGRRVALHASAGTAWTVVREADAAPRAAPLHRFARVHPARDLAACLDALRPLARHLAAAAIEGFGAATRDVAVALAELGASRVCEPGRLQAPPLAWRHEGRGVLLPFARFADLEVG